MKTVDYDKQDKNTGNTETHLAVDAAIENNFAHPELAYEEGFASASGVRGGTAETGGRLKHPEKGDDASNSRVPSSIENQNPGLAD